MPANNIHNPNAALSSVDNIQQSREITAGEGRGLKDDAGVLGHGRSYKALHV
jgi:hypothetical protein